jgi:hypothetical protein
MFKEVIHTLIEMFQSPKQIYKKKPLKESKFKSFSVSFFTI